MKEIRLSPSGPVVATIGDGFATRTVEKMSPITGELSVPATLAAGVVCSDGFGGTAPVTVDMLTPSAALKYSAEAWVDVWNQSTQTESRVIVELQISDDDGATWQSVARNQHQVIENLEGGTARMVQLNLVPTLGATLGISADAATLAMRVRMSTPDLANVEVYSPPIDGDGNAGLKGCFFMRLTEHLAG